MKKAHQQILAFIFGIVFVCVLLVIALFLPNPTSFQFTVFKVVLALAAGGIGAMLPGSLGLDLPVGVKAAGALGVFAIVFFFSPAQMLVATSVIVPAPVDEIGSNVMITHDGDDPAYRDEAIEDVSYLADEKKFRVTLRPGRSSGSFKALHTNRSQRERYFVTYHVTTSGLQHYEVTEWSPL